jgi:hypothetical protein
MRQACFRKLYLQRLAELLPAGYGDADVWRCAYQAVRETMAAGASKGKGPRSDRTAIAVIGIDQGGNKYLIDDYCHRMKLSERWRCIKTMKAVAGPTTHSAGVPPPGGRGHVRGRCAGVLPSFEA